MENNKEVNIAKIHQKANSQLNYIKLTLPDKGYVDIIIEEGNFRVYYSKVLDGWVPYRHKKLI